MSSLLALTLAALLGAPAPGPLAGACAGGEPLAEAAYYDIELVPTGRVPGTRSARGVAKLTSAASPFGIALTADGRYRQRLTLRVDGVLPVVPGQLVAWITTVEIDQVQRLGELATGAEVGGEVEWNKFLVVVTLEPDGEASPRWRGPVVLRGASRSGRMHTMAGHGPYEGEPCVKYGY